MEETTYDTTSDTYEISTEEQALTDDDHDWEEMGTTQITDKADEFSPMALANDEQATVRSKRKGHRFPGRVIGVRVPSELRDKCEDFPETNTFRIHNLAETIQYAAYEYPFLREIYASDTRIAKVKRFLDQSVIGTALHEGPYVASRLFRKLRALIAAIATYPLKFTAPASIGDRVTFVIGGLVVMALIDGLLAVPKAIWNTAAAVFFVFIATLPRVGPAFYALVVAFWSVTYAGVIEIDPSNSFVTIEAGIAMAACLLLSMIYAYFASGTKYAP